MVCEKLLYQSDGQTLNYGNLNFPWNLNCEQKFVIDVVSIAKIILGWLGTSSNHWSNMVQKCGVCPGGNHAEIQLPPPPPPPPPPPTHTHTHTHNNLNYKLINNPLTHLSVDKMAVTENIFKCISVNGKCCISIKFHWSLFLKVQLRISQHWFRKWLGTTQASSHYLNQCWPIPPTHICCTRGTWVN